MPLLIPLAAGGVGFVAGSLTSGLLNSLFKLGLLAAGVYYFLMRGSRP